MNGSIIRQSELWNFDPEACCNAKFFILREQRSPEWTWAIKSLWLLGFKEAKL